MAGGVRKMVRTALRGTSWSHLVDYASPALFDVVPARALLAQSRELFANRRDSERFSEVCEALGTVLRQRGVEVELTHGTPRADDVSLSDLDEAARREVGQRILEIFFTQILTMDDALLDLRSEKLTSGPKGILRWRPGALYVRWQPEFVAGARDLYRGFYLEDDARFEDALQQLGIEGSGDVLRDVIGRDDPANTRFDVEAFHASFHELFVTYRDRGVALHRNFLPLGISLMCLYETLDALAVPLDVRDAFHRGHAPPSKLE